MSKSNNLKVRLCLVEYNVTQRHLAELIGITPTTLSRRFRVEQPEHIQDWLCDVIQGDMTHIQELKAYFDFKQRPSGEKNRKVTECLNEYQLYRWQLAERIGIQPNQLSTWLHTERPDDVQEKLCEVIKGNLDHVDEIKNYFTKKTMAENNQAQNCYANKICWEIELKELENDIEKQKERDEWLYEYTKGR